MYHSIRVLATLGGIAASSGFVGNNHVSSGCGCYCLKNSCRPATSANTVDVDFKAYAKGYKTIFAELPAAECTPSTGELPTDLKGTYYKCGPAMFSAGSIAPPSTSIIQPRDGPPVPDGQSPKRMVQHPFEGDGGMLGVTFRGDGESVSARYRYVRTVAFTNERRKGQRLYKGMDSTRELGPSIGNGMGNDLHSPLFRHHLQPGLNKNRKNTANTRAVYWGKRLITMWEGGQPYKMDSLALSTEGRSQLGGVLDEPDPLGSKAVIDPSVDRVLMYGVNQNAKTSEITLYEFNNDFRMVNSKDEKLTYPIPGFALISDMAATKNFGVFVQPPTSTTMQFLVIKEPGKVVKVENSPAFIHLLPRFGSKESVVSAEIPFDGVPEAELQLINAYEDDSLVVIDAIRPDGSSKSQTTSSTPAWPWATSRDEYEKNSAKRSLWRYTVDKRKGTTTKECLTKTQCFFGTVAPTESTQQHRYLYMAIGGLGEDVAPPQGVARFDTEKKTMDAWMPEAFEFCGEPMFAPKEDSKEDEDGYILTVLFNGKTEQSELVVLRSTAIGEGPVTRIPLGLGIPHGLHGCFTAGEECLWEGEEIMRRAKLADKMESRGNLWNEVKSDFSGLGLRFDDMEEYFGDSFLS